MYNAQQLDILKNTLSAVIANSERLLIGDNDGLYMLDLMEEELYKFTDKDVRRVTQIQIIPDEQLIALLAGEFILGIIIILYVSNW